MCLRVLNVVLPGWRPEPDLIFLKNEISQKLPRVISMKVCGEDIKNKTKKEEKKKKKIFHPIFQSFLF